MYVRIPVRVVVVGDVLFEDVEYGVQAGARVAARARLAQRRATHLYVKRYGEARWKRIALLYVHKKKIVNAMFRSDLLSILLFSQQYVGQIRVVFSFIIVLLQRIEAGLLFLQQILALLVAIAISM